MKRFMTLATIATLMMGTVSQASTSWENELTKDNLSAGQLDSPDPSSVIESAYTTTTLIQRALEDAKTLPLGPRIRHFEDAVAKIVRKSGQNPFEEPVRLTLQRSKSVGDLTLKVAGYNSELIAQWAANFYRTSFELALAYANNPCKIRTYQSTFASGNFSETSIAQYGFYYSSLLWRNQANIVSDSAKAVILVKLVGFLGQDLNNDLRRRTDGMREALADIYDIQNNDGAYRRIIASFSRNQQPNTSDVTALRVKVYKVWSQMAHRLSASGVYTEATPR
ncbi:hypothetical protein [Bdellovibrio sp. HCB2-146]|uniref:hypothetical protein n=1 Tax=Bdellovibrio sp. HCB2-146 TaxID=3394362 RepID=UPI0039BC992F